MSSDSFLGDLEAGGPAGRPGRWSTGVVWQRSGCELSLVGLRSNEVDEHGHIPSFFKGNCSLDFRFGAVRNSCVSVSKDVCCQVLCVLPGRHLIEVHYEVSCCTESSVSVQVTS